MSRLIFKGGPLALLERRLFPLALAASLVLTIGCGEQDSPADRAPQAIAPAAQKQALSADDGPRLAGPPTRENMEALPAPPKVAADDEDEDDEKKDYWAKIPFTMANFDEVREYVKTYYIEADVDERGAFIEAANFALMEMDPARELVPASFHKARKKDPREEGRLSGKTYKLDDSNEYLIHIIPEEEELIKKGLRKKDDKKKRLTDDEIRAKRKELQERRKDFETAWSTIEFGEDQFKMVLEHIEGKLKAGKNGKKDMKPYYVAAAQGYLYSLDPHSSLVSAEAWDESTRETTDSSFEGIGAILTQRNDYTIVESPLEGRPAHKAGVRAGDRILKVDGKDIVGLPLHKVVKKIRGPKGTPVKLTVAREGDPDEHVVTIHRAHIAMENVTSRLLEPHHPGIGYIKVKGFVPSTEEKVKEAYETLQKENAKLHDGAELRGIVLDLRNNSGGLLNQGVKLADLFVEKGTIVEVRNRVRRDETYTADARGTWDLPVIVLVNDGAASASEIVASAIQDNGAGLVVGDRTFGKASVQTLFSPILRKDYYIKLTIARYFSPSGRTIQVVGVQPDFEVPPDVGGKMPLGFREENLSHHLAPIAAKYKSPNPDLVQRVSECAELRGVAERIHANDPKPQVKYDYQLMKGADYMECYADLLKQETAKR